MKTVETLGEGRGEEKGSMRGTRELLKRYLRPLEPDAHFARRLEHLCRSMGAEEMFCDQKEWREKAGRKGYLIGGAICSALPFLGVAAYAVSKYVLRRRVVPISA